MNNSKVWFVTGASKGLGLSLVKKLLAAGYKVAATSRTIDALTHAIGQASPQFLPLQADLTNEASVQKAIADTISQFNTIDVVVNNAGYGQIGTLEELTDAEARGNFDVNVFGLLHVIRNTMPQLRAQGSGHIFNISSIGGYTAAFAGWGVYCATKFAVAGLTEALSAESTAFGIHATVVYPGYFRTSFLSGESISTPKHPIAAYQAARDSQVMHEQQINGNQQGDPDKAADVLIQAAESDTPPLHLFLGQDAYDRAADKISDVRNDLAAWESVAAGATAFDE